MIELEIKTTGIRTKHSRNFGYQVKSKVQGSLMPTMDYENRAIFIDGKYFLEETKEDFLNYGGFSKIKTVNKIEAADAILYNRAVKAAKKSLDNITPDLIGSRTGLGAGGNPRFTVREY